MLFSSSWPTRKRTTAVDTPGTIEMLGREVLPKLRELTEGN